MSTSSMHGFDKNNCLRRYEKVNEILNEFYTLRLEFYVKRKDYLEGMLTAEAARLSDQARFIMEKCMWIRPINIHIPIVTKFFSF